MHMDVSQLYLLGCQLENMKIQNSFVYPKISPNNIGHFRPNKIPEIYSTVWTIQSDECLFLSLFLHWMFHHLATSCRWKDFLKRKKSPQFPMTLRFLPISSDFVPDKLVNNEKEQFSPNWSRNVCDKYVLFAFVRLRTQNPKIRITQTRSIVQCDRNHVDTMANKSHGYRINRSLLHPVVSGLRIRFSPRIRSTSYWI